MSGVRAVRRAAGMSQTDAAEAWGRSQSQVARIESLELERLKIGTLCEFITSIGGTLEINASINDQRFSLVLAQPDQLQLRQ